MQLTTLLDDICIADLACALVTVSTGARHDSATAEHRLTFSAGIMESRYKYQSSAMLTIVCNL